ncbi:hypothetical protein MTR_7g085690 [Medicago truncatula]|uniref:Uncharacterized protein n=1 Tax=Medicago truncatula TaxID=3880 RepID=A0A072UCG0_MEDTR|nr:hypothetical protein MTR_7g085690 [Medicago truncatula]
MVMMMMKKKAYNDRYLDSEKKKKDDDQQTVKTRLIQWPQVVACAVASVSLVTKQEFLVVVVIDIRVMTERRKKDVEN